MLLRSALVAALLIAPGCKDDEEAEAPEPQAEAATGGTDQAESTGPAPAPPEPGERADLRRLKFGETPNWTARYDDFLQSWTFERTDGPNKAASRFYVGHMPPGAPTAVDHYASKLRHDPEFQDVGYVYTEVTDKIVSAGGWTILGLERDAADPKSTPQPSFVQYRTLSGQPIRCRGGRFADPKHRQEARAICEAATF